MFDTIYKSKFFIDEMEQSPYSKHFKDLIKWTLNEGYPPIAIRNNFGSIIHFIRWSAYRGVTPKTIRRLHVDQFLKILLNGNKSTVGGYGWAPLKRFLKSLQTPANAPLIEDLVEKTPDWVNDHADAAIVHLRSVNGLAEKTLIRIRGMIRTFLLWKFENRKGRISELDSKSILLFVELRSKTLSPSSLQTEFGYYKSYFRYLYAKGMTKFNLCLAVPKMADWKNTRHIHVLTAKEMQAMLKTTDMTTPQGVRDFAILVLLSRYGLRSIEIVRLRLSDIVWREKVMVIHGKGKKISELPLDEDVAATLKQYIDNARPFSSSDKLFLTSRAPYKELSETSPITKIVTDALIRADIKTPFKGARLFRYSVASNILNAGGTLREVQQLLRHEDSNTTAGYIRVDFKRLSFAAQPWPTEDHI